MSTSSTVPCYRQEANMEAVPVQIRSELLGNPTDLVDQGPQGRELTSVQGCLSLLSLGARDLHLIDLLSDILGHAQLDTVLA
eukprot:2000477-Amphidinium_carterae.1